jgi:hypothetical protein
MFDPESAIGIGLRLWVFSPGELVILIVAIVLLFCVVTFYRQNTHPKFSRSDPILALAIGCGPALFLICIAFCGLGALLVFPTLFSLIVFYKKLRHKMVLFALLSTGLTLTIFSWDIHRNYLLSCLDAEDDPVAAWAYHDLSHDNANIRWLLTVMNDPRESQYVRFYVGQILAERLRQLPPQKRLQILSQLDPVANIEDFAPFQWTDENRKAQKITYPASPRGMVSQLMAFN